MRTALTIAGSDSGGGAGIQADLKAFAASGVHGTSVLTSITAQNTQGVRRAYHLPLEEIEAQMDAVAEDFAVGSVKTGMLATSGIVSLVARKVAELGWENLVVDPVMVSATGDPLSEGKSQQQALVADLLPLARVVTPNLDEAEALTGEPIRSLEGMREAAQRIYSFGPASVLIKGGHLGGPATDLLFDGQEFYPFEADRVKGVRTHGAGCALAAAIAGYLARGRDVREAILQAKTLVTEAIQHCLRVGQGVHPVHPLAGLYIQAWGEADPDGEG